jgi:hypothetical protein
MRLPDPFSSNLKVSEAACVDGSVMHGYGCVIRDRSMLFIHHRVCEAACVWMRMHVVHACHYADCLTHFIQPPRSVRL